jgi:hypothetical protein
MEAATIRCCFDMLESRAPIITRASTAFRQYLYKQTYLYLKAPTVSLLCPLIQRKGSEMIKISIENLQQGVDAESAFFGFLCRLVRDRSLLQSRTAFFPLNFPFASYVRVEVSVECCPDVDPHILELGAFLACVCKLYQLASTDQISGEPWQRINSAIASSKFSDESNAHRMVEFLLQGELGSAEKCLEQLYSLFVKGWWLNLPGSGRVGAY